MGLANHRLGDDVDGLGHVQRHDFPVDHELVVTADGTQFPQDPKGECGGAGVTQIDFDLH